jgi:pimeloyl-ACP methyl ester carboxylesterase
MNGIPSQHVVVDGLCLHYQRAGRGEAVLVLHGWGGSVATVQPLVQYLTQNHSVVVLDLPGHGQSSMPPNVWTVSDYMACVVQAMDLLELQRVHIVGHSFGARIAIKLAVAHPQRVDKLVLLNAAGVRPPRGMRYYGRYAIGRLGKALAACFGKLGRRAQSRLYSLAASPDYLRSGPLRETFVKVVNEDLRPLLPSVRPPALLIWGASDKDTPPMLGRIMAREMSNAQLVVLEGAGHFCYIDQPMKVGLLVNKFLRG